ncbi:MAG: styrene monooxygenase/indole monooxygenase family protein, partial [Candidatus Angelobacter sp.]
TGTGEIGKIFDRDPNLSAFASPLRNTTMLYVSELNFDSVQGGLVLIPGVGEIVWLPAFSLTGPCFIVGFGAVIGGEMDIFSGRESPKSAIELGRGILARFVPWHAREWWRIDLLDGNGFLTAAITPAVRKPSARLPSGKLVLGIGDAVILNDPIAAQGSNNAAKAADHYLKAIVEHGIRPFDAAWMEEMFSAYWEDAQWSVALSNAFLKSMPAHVRDLFKAAEKSQTLREIIMDGYNRPETLFPWMLDAELTHKLVEQRS